MKPLALTPWLLLGLLSLGNGVFPGGALRAAEPDRTGPRLVSAWVEDGSTNLIRMRFDGPLLPGSARNTNNYALTLFGTTNQVPVERVLYPFGPWANALLAVGTNNWHLSGGSNYYLTVNGVRDSSSNSIAPDSRIGLSRLLHYTNVLRADAVWRYGPHNFQQPWASCESAEDPWWAEGAGPFRSGSGWPPPEECFGPGTNLFFGSDPVLFRTRFVCPPELAAFGLLKLDWLVHSSAILYLNGVEIFRLYLCPLPADLTNQAAACCMHFVVAPPTCGTSVVAVTNLVAGTNCLAAAILPSHCLPVSFGSGFDLAFGLSLSAARMVTGPVPAEAQPMLRIAPLSNDAVRLWWTGSGYALESTTNLPFSALTSGSWWEAPDMSNPYTNSTSPNANRFFRLRK
jgi:hypothetical protein